MAKKKKKVKEKFKEKFKDLCLELGALHIIQTLVLITVVIIHMSRISIPETKGHKVKRSPLKVTLNLKYITGERTAS